MSVPSLARATLSGSLCLLAALALLAGCSDDERTDDLNPTPDAGFETQDAEATDAELADADGIDTGAPDSGEPADMGFVDMGFPDMGFPDSGAFEDAGAPDLGADAGINLTCDPTFFPTGACGGTLSGTTWRYRASCGNSETVANFLSDCPGSAILNVTRSVTGTATFSGTNSDFELRFTDRSEATVDVGTFCVTVAGSCAGVEAAVRFSDPNATCTEVGGACQCDIVFEEELERDGIFGVNGNQFTTEDGDLVETYDFCVSMGAFRYSDTAEQRTFVLSP